MGLMTIKPATENILEITIAADNQNVQSVLAGAEEIDAFIAQLIRFRSTMKPELPRMPHSAQWGPMDPLWQGGSHDQSDTRQLSIRHPGIGWLSFLFSQEAARRLADYLMKGPAETTAHHPRSLH